MDIPVVYRGKREGWITINGDQAVLMSHRELAGQVSEEVLAYFGRKVRLHQQFNYVP
jgi:hypothetical protein